MKMIEIKGKRNRLKQYSWEDKIFLSMVYGITILITLICLYPLYYVVVASVSDAYAVYGGETYLWPVDFNFNAYKLVFENKQIWRGYANTIYYTVVGTLLNLFLTIPAAYALSKKQMYGRGFLMKVFLITMYFSGGMIPTYLLMDKLGLMNTRTILIITGGISVYNTIVARTYFQNNIPEALFDAAKIDGAGELNIFLKMVTPLSKPILAVMTLYYAVSHWNSYFTALIYVLDQELHPLQLVLRKILILNEAAYDEALAGNVTDAILMDAAERAHQALTMKYAIVFIASAPMIMIYPFIQKYFVKGVMIGSVKE